MGPSRCAKKASRAAESSASNVAALTAPSSAAAVCSRSGLRAVRISSAPSARARLAVSSPIACAAADDDDGLPAQLRLPLGGRGDRFDGHLNRLRSAPPSPRLAPVTSATDPSIFMCAPFRDWRVDTELVRRDQLLRRATLLVVCATGRSFAWQARRRAANRAESPDSPTGASHRVGAASTCCRRGPRSPPSCRLLAYPTEATPMDSPTIQDEGQASAGRLSCRA